MFFTGLANDLQGVNGKPVSWVEVRDPTLFKKNAKHTIQNYVLPWSEI